MRILLLDNNPADMDHLEKYIVKYEKQQNVNLEVDKFTSCDAFLLACEDTAEQPYLVIIDMDLKGTNGIAVAQELRAKGNTVRLIFTDKSTDNAMAAFEVMADGYIKKPVVYEDFANAMNRFRPRFAMESNTIEIRAERSKVHLHTNDIYYAETSGHNVWIYCRGGDYKTPLSMTELFEQLQEEKTFLPCGRSYLVNMKYITAMEKEVIVMENGYRVPIPVRLRKTVMERYRAYMREKHF